MAIVCPAVLEESLEKYHDTMEKVARFAHRIQVDLTDGEFAKPKTVSPKEAWWPVGVRADIHLMYNQPISAAKAIIEHKPHLIIVHAECRGDFSEFAELCKKHGVKVGVALLPGTSPLVIAGALPIIDHVLIFSGELGKYGGQADLDLLEKVKILKAGKHSLEVGWDGGVNDQNVSRLVHGGIDVLNVGVGGFLQKAETPEKGYKTLQRIAAETGSA